MNKHLITATIGLFIIMTLFFSSGCGPSLEDQAATSAAQTAAAVTDTPSSPTTLDNLKDMDPTYEIFFDGETCIVDGPAELTPGEYMFILHNETDLPATLWLASYFGEGSFDDHLLWKEENCGGQGSHCENAEGNMISYSLISWGNAKKQAQEGIEDYYKIYDISYIREHAIYVSSDGWWGWICAPIQVSN